MIATARTSGEAKKPGMKLAQGTGRLSPGSKIVLQSRSGRADRQEWVVLEHDQEAPVKVGTLNFVTRGVHHSQRA